MEPLRNESIQQYAQRMAGGISKQPYILVGLSFGGIMSIEINKIKPAEKIFLISSLSNHHERPWYMNLFRFTQLHRIGFHHLFKQIPFIVNWAFGAGNSRLKSYLKERIQAISSNYLNWSIRTILTWKQEAKPNHVVHIHGSADKIFPIHFVDADYVIPRGSHFMVYTQADKISEIILSEIKTGMKINPYRFKTLL
jgi:hypothetical protein